MTITLTEDQLRAMIAQEVARILATSAPSPETPTDARDLLRVSEAAALSGLSRKTIYNYQSEGRLMRHGLPRAPMVSRAELLGLMTRARPKGAG